MRNIYNYWLAITFTYAKCYNGLPWQGRQRRFLRDFVFFLRFQCKRFIFIKFYAKVKIVKIKSMNKINIKIIYLQTKGMAIMTTIIGISFLALELLGVFILSAVSPN
ncbi:Putative uncharacterized protein [Lactobacillus helveticus H10]|nr:Putative uncharacterized protein [Lactobacillus helveticus H10]